MKENKKYYKVVCMCGHVGRKKYVPIAFAVEAVDGKEAAKLARKIPRVKHDRKDAIIQCVEISKAQYKELRKINNEDPYLNCSNIQSQRKIPDFGLRIVKIIDESCGRKNSKEALSNKYREFRKGTANCRDGWRDLLEELYVEAY